MSPLMEGYQFHDVDGFTVDLQSSAGEDPPEIF